MLKFKNYKIKKDLISTIVFDGSIITINYSKNKKLEFKKQNESDFNFIIGQLNNFVRLQDTLYNRNMITLAEYTKKFGLYCEEPTMRGKIYLTLDRLDKIEQYEIVYGYLGDCEREFNNI